MTDDSVSYLSDRSVGVPKMTLWWMTWDVWRRLTRMGHQSHASSTS